MRSVQRQKRVVFIPPFDINGSPQGGNLDCLSMRHIGHVALVFTFGSIAGDVDITLQQAKNVGGNSAKSLSFDKIYVMNSQATELDSRDKVTEEVVTNDSFTVQASIHDDYQFIVEIDEADLDTNGGFDCIRPVLSDPEAACLVSVVADCYQLSFSGDPSNQSVFPSALTN